VPVPLNMAVLHPYTHLTSRHCCSPHVTIISGTNGSGKSAMLQGLQCALGASAKGTGRGSKMEDLVRPGADKAQVKVRSSCAG
jgi:chromosome segregation ATPase